jgi:2Fe-2S ferredoxin
MARIHVVFESGEPARTIEFDPREEPIQQDRQPASVLDVLLGHGISLEHACGGSCACTTCHLFIREGEANLSEPADNELDRLDTAWDLRTNSRLGCQAVIKGDVVAEFPMYTRNYVQEGGDIQLGKPERRDENAKAEVLS